MAKEMMAFRKLKLAELKQEFLGHGLKIEGIKHVHIKRLQAYPKEHTEWEAKQRCTGRQIEEEPKPIGLAVKEEDSSKITVDVAVEKVVVKTTVKRHR